MNKSDEQQGKVTQKSQAQSRFEAMSWLYRDGLSYQPLNQQKAPEVRTQAKEQQRVLSSAPLPAKTPVPVHKQPNEPSRGDRFKSMSWLYRDGLQTAASNQQTPISKSKPEVSLREKPTVTDVLTISPPPKPSSTKTSSTSIKNNDKYEAMRWLYEDDASFEKAVQELKTIEAAKQLKKEQAKQARKDRIQKARTSVVAQKKRVVQYARTEPKKTLIGASVATVVLLIITVGSIGMGRSGSSDSAKVAGDATLNQTDPEFDALLPNNDTSQAESGIAYDEKRKVANYIDTVDSTRVTLSQQPLPERFTVNQAVELEKFAKEINANQFIQAGDTKAYAGLSMEGPQTVVLIKNDLLVFMKADKEISTGAWMAYIESLE